MRQPDIEIYLREDCLDALQQWLGQHLGEVQLSPKPGTTQHGTVHGETAIPMLIVRKAAGKWASVWFTSDRTPWATDLDCARALATGMGVEVRCSTGGWDEQQGLADADLWMKVTATGEETFIWKQ